MRTQTAGESTLLAGNNYAIHQRVKVANGSGTLVDYSDYAERITVDEDIDQPTAQATVQLRRDASSTLSLAPLRTDSTLNRLDDGVTYSPALDAGRLITIETATTAIGTAPVAGDWKEIFRGYVDSADVASSAVSIVCRDLGGVLVDRWIETEKAYGYDTSISTVMQAILDDTLGAGVVTLTTVGTPSFNIRTYTQQSEPLMDALRALAQLIGWDVRYKWNGTAFVLTLHEPPRSKTVPDRTFGPSTYYDVTRLTLDRVDVRNAITIDYPASGGRATLTTTDATSISRYGRRFLGITEASDSSIDTLSEANVLIGNVLSDLKDPKAEQEIEGQFFWPAELGDLYRFSANSVHYNSDQDWAATNIRHEWYDGTGRTYLQVRGAPSGGFLTWITKPLQPPERPTFNRILNFREVARTTATATIGWAMDRLPEEIWLWLSTPAQPVASDPYAALVGTPTVRLTPTTTSYEVTIPRQGLITYGRLMPVYPHSVVGDTWDFTVQPGTAERLIQRAKITSTTATQVQITVAVANPTTGSDVTISYTSVGGGAITPASGQTILAASVTDDIDTTGTVVFTATRPSGSGGGIPGAVIFTASSTDRLPDVDTVTIPAQDFPTTALVGTIATAQIADAAITAAKIGAAAVETAKLANLAVTDAILAAGAVTTTKITDTAVTAAKIAANTITAAQIAAGTITTTEIAANTITAGDIAAGTITATEIAASTITGGKIAALTIAAGNIAANAIETDKIAANAVTATKISVTNLAAINADLGLITAGHIRNAGDTAAIRMSGTTALPATNFIDFTATTTAPFLKHGGVELRSDGTARVGSTSTFENPTGTLGDTVQQNVAGTARRLAKGYQSGSTVDGGSVTFSPAFQAVPMVLFRDAGLVWDGTLSTTVNTSTEINANSLSASGFTCHAKLRQTATLTARNEVFTTPLSVTTAGSTVGAATLNNAPSNDGTYKARWKITVDCTTTAEIPTGSVEAITAVEASADGGTTWVERGTKSRTVSRTTAGTTSTTFDPEELTITDTALSNAAPADQIRLKLKEINITGADTLGTVTLEGFDNSPTAEGYGVVYTSSSGDTIVSKTPGSTHKIYWEAFEVTQ